jgi:RPA family protein
MEKLTISRNALEILAQEMLDLWSHDVLELTLARDRKIAGAMDEVIELLNLQSQLDDERNAQMAERNRIWQEQQAKKAN